MIAPAQGRRAVNWQTGSRIVHYEVAGETRSLRARLVVAADGARSLVRDQAGIDAEHIGLRAGRDHRHA